MKTLKYLLIGIILIVYIALSGCSKNDYNSDLKNQANTFINTITQTKNIDSFIALYNDPVIYSDPVWGAIEEPVSLDTLKLWFQPVFDPKTGWDFEINTIALDQVNNIFAIKGYSIDIETGARRLISSWLEIENGKISKQTDLTPWSLESLKYSPRFEEALKHISAKGDSIIH